MPTKRRRRERFRRPDVDPVHWAMLTDAPIPEDGNPFAEFRFDALARELWQKCREDILRDWIENKPGTRPSHWWLFDAPRMTEPGKLLGYYGLKELCDPRRLLSGIGVPAWEQSALAPRMHLGIWADWTGGDPDQLVFESQYDYLKRWRLLEAGEGESREPKYTPRKFH